MGYDYFSIQWAVVFTALLIPGFYYLQKYFETSLVALVSYLVGRCLLESIIPYSELPKKAIIALHAGAESALLAIIILVIFQCFYSRTEKLYHGLAYLYVFTLISTIIGQFIPHWHGGLTLNEKMDACLIIMLMPFTRFLLKPKIWVVLGLILIALSHSFTAFLGVIGVGISYFRRDKFKVIALILLLVGGFFFFRTQLAHNDRLEMWLKFMEEWAGNFNGFIGAGPNSFLVWGPVMQHVWNPNTTSMWAWLHNDWLQLIFEYGLIGWTCAMLLFFEFFRNTMDRPWLQSAFIAGNLTAFFYYPAHWPLHAFVGSSIVFSGLRRGTHEIQAQANCH